MGTTLQHVGFSTSGFFGNIWVVRQSSSCSTRCTTAATKQNDVGCECHVVGIGWIPKIQFVLFGKIVSRIRDVLVESDSIETFGECSQRSQLLQQHSVSTLTTVGKPNVGIMGLLADFRFLPFSLTVLWFPTCRLN